MGSARRRDETVVMVSIRAVVAFEDVARLPTVVALEVILLMTFLRVMDR